MTKSNEAEDKAVMDKLNELNETIQRRRKFHPSEEANRDYNSWQPNLKIYDVVNSYHAYCKLCSQHLYAHSVLTDINSFFQKHINTSLHKSSLLVNSYPDNLPIFTWETYLETGRCNVCEMSGLHAYIIDSILNVTKLIHLHNCDWEKSFRENNGKIVYKIAILKQFCNVNLLKNLFVIEDDSNYVCWLCNKKLMKSKEKNYYHLLLDDHFKLFCDFLWKIFHMTMTDLLNGFNLERVIRWALYNDMAPYRICSGRPNDCDEHMKCVQQSNDASHIYENIDYNAGFTPIFIKEILKIQNNDFLYQNKCLLCEEDVVDPFHMVSESHCQKLESYDNFSSDKNSNYEIYLRNREKRLHPYEHQIKMFNHLLDELKACNIELGQIYEEDCTEILIKALEDKIRLIGMNNILEYLQNNSLENSKQTYIQKLIEIKLNKLKNVFTNINGKYTTCEFCDHKVLVKMKEQHLYGKEHRGQVESWNILKVKLKISKFSEPVVKHEKEIICLICGLVFCEEAVFCHFKSAIHSENFEVYEKTTCSTPISSSFFFYDKCCICQLCNIQINRSNVSLRTTVVNIKKHWPCTGSKTKIQGMMNLLLHEIPKSCSEKVENNESDSLMRDESRVKGLSILCVKCGLPFSENEIIDHVRLCTPVGAVNLYNFKETVQNIMEVFEDEIIQNVTDSFCKVINGKTEVGECLQTDEYASRDLSQKNENIIEKDNSLAKTEIPTQVTNNESTAQVLSEELNEDNDIKELETGDVQDLQKTEDDDETNQNVADKNEGKTNEFDEFTEQALIIKDLPKNIKNIHKVVYFIFQKYGEIKFFEIQKTIGMLIYEIPEIAQEVVKKEFFLDSQRLQLTTARVESGGKLGLRRIILNRDVAFIMDNPLRLINYCNNLIAQSVIFDTPIERAREKFVCGSIVSAVSSCYANSKCYGFGSRLSGLTTVNSDFDVFLDCGGMFDGINRTGDCPDIILNKVGNALKGRLEFKNIRIIGKARVPIVSFLHTPTNLYCDLSFKNGLSVQNTKLLRFMVSLDARVKPLILFLKLWANVHRLHGPPCFSSYAIAMMVIFYLQQLPNPVLPAVETLQKNYIGTRLTIDGWDCNFSIDVASIPKITNNEPFQSILLGFFDFYTNFKYSEYVISPLTGNPVLRSSFARKESFDLPASYARHIVNLPVENYVYQYIPIVIIDPFDLSHILTKSFPQRTLSYFIELCKLSANKIRRGMSMEVTAKSSLQNPFSRKTPFQHFK